MSFTINQVAISGNLTADPERHEYGSEGKALLSFTVAVHERRKKGGEWVDEAHYVDVKTFNTVDWLAANLSKGSPVVVAGRLRQERWEKDGQKRSKIAVVAHDVKPMGQSEQRAETSQPTPANDFVDSDIPF